MVNTNKQSVFRSFIVIASFILAMAAAGIPGQKPVQASNFTVTRFDDVFRGTCAPGDCSLREAISAANTNPGVDNIYLSSGTYTLSIAGAGENLNATGDLDIFGPDVTNLYGAGSNLTTITAVPGWGDRILNMTSTTVNTTLTGLTITGGNTPDGGGGIYSHGSLVLTDVTVKDNFASGNFGGGIFSGVYLSMTNSNVTGNQAANGGAIYTGDLVLNHTLIADNHATSLGGAIELATSGFIQDSTISGNSGTAGGGGIMDMGSNLTINNSNLGYNTALSGDGGAINQISGYLTINNSSFFHNESNYHGGALYVSSLSPVSIHNSTFSNNSSGYGAVYAYTGSSISMNNDTIVSNKSASANGAILNGGAMTVDNSIIAGNYYGNITYMDCSGNALQGDYNLVQPSDGCSFTGALNNQVTSDPKVGILGLHGGSTYVNPLLPGSPALDHGNPGTPGTFAGTCMATDQHGTTRPVGSYCDIGSFEGVVHLSFIPLAIR